MLDSLSPSFTPISFLIDTRSSVVCKLFTFQASSPKPLGQLEPNLAGMFLGWYINFVEDLPMIIPGQFGFNYPSGFREEAF
jgi:hypothetical protein